MKVGDQRYLIHFESQFDIKILLLLKPCPYLAFLTTYPEIFACLFVVTIAYVRSTCSGWILLHKWAHYANLGFQMDQKVFHNGKLYSYKRWEKDSLYWKVTNIKAFRSNYKLSRILSHSKPAPPFISAGGMWSTKSEERHRDVRQFPRSAARWLRGRRTSCRGALPCLTAPFCPAPLCSAQSCPAQSRPGKNRPNLPLIDPGGASRQWWWQRRRWRLSQGYSLI